MPADSACSGSVRCLASVAWLWGGLLAASLPGCGPPADPRVRPERPVHVVLYVIDTLRRDRLGVYGYERGTSPAIDALAAESVVFDNAHAAAPWTLPSMVSLMTSTYPVDHGVLHGKQKLAPGVDTLPVRLDALGYRTAGFVMNPFAGDYAGLRRGYDHYEVTAGAPFLRRFLTGQIDGPLFLYHHTTEPHRPFRAPAAYEARFGATPAAVRDRINRQTARHLELLRVDAHRGRPPGTTDNHAQQDHVLRELRSDLPAINDLYDASVAWADDNLGQAVTLLKARGLWDDTLFILLSDHGEELLDHGGVGHAQSVYDELVRVPMLWRFPGGAGGGTRVSDAVTLVDVMPTLLDYLGHDDKWPDDLGRSFLPLLASGSGHSESHPAVTSVRIARDLHNGPSVDLRGRVNVAVTQSRWKGIWNQETETFELYDRERDPDEQTDRSMFEPDVSQRLEEAARRWVAERPASAPQGLVVAEEERASEEVDPETLERLRHLGYIDASP